MSPRVFREGDLIFWFHSYDASVENRASVHVGKGSQNDSTNPKIWLEPQVEVARVGRTLNQGELNRALKLVDRNRERLLEAWHAHRCRTN